VVLLDVYAQFGDVALMMNLRPKRTLVELVPLEDELDAELLEAYLTPHPSGLKVLVGSSDPLELDAISIRCLSAVLNILKRSHRFIVMDVPPMLYATTIHALTHSYYILLVANLYDLTTVNDTRKLYRTLVREYVPREKVRIVLNRVSRHNRLQASEIERTFGQGITAQIPNAGHIVVSSVNEGRPFVLTHPSSPVSRSIRALAAKVTAPLANLDNGVGPAHSPLPDLVPEGEGA
jgi:pilus assembly protein CpaE